MIFYIILGCVMDELSMILLTIPIIFPVVMGLDFFGLAPTDKAIWFGILILMVVEIGHDLPAGGAERLHHERPGQGRAAWPRPTRAWCRS